MTDIQKLSSTEYFFLYDKIPIEQMNEHELMLILIQPKQSLYYNRSIGAGVQDSENYPNGMAMNVSLRYAIVNSVANRNAQVVSSDGQRPERRIALGWESVGLRKAGKDMDLLAYYVNLNNYEQANNVSLPLTRP